MSDLQDKLMSGIMNLLDTAIKDSYIVTDGLKVATIVLDKKIAEYFCKEMRRKHNTERWIYLSVPQAIEYAFACGREYAINEMNNNGMEGGNGEDSELRSSDVQQEEKSN